MEKIMNNYFNDCIDFNVTQPAQETINLLYKLFIANDDFNKEFYKIPLCNSNDLIIHLMTDINTTVWESIAEENEKYTNYSKRQINIFNPTVKLESGYILFNNEIDNFIEEANDINEIIQLIIDFFRDNTDE